MQELQRKFKKVISDLEKNLKDKEDLEYVKTQIYKVYTMFLDEFDKLEESSTQKIDSIVARYAGLEDRITELEGTLDKIEKDLYIEEEYDLDIVCPYCNTEFTIDDSEELKDKVICPKCNNVIELDWNDETHECSHDCHDCEHDCNSNEVTDEDEDM